LLKQRFLALTRPSFYYLLHQSEAPSFAK